ncbi:MAG: hypothetical protein JWM68_2079 [Verrucomicrobiales bacterium]|nr:hypothetical protein [Verrucomicrobiales bacterium]
MYHQDFEFGSPETFVQRFRLKILNAALMLPPTTVMVCLRHNVGYRVLFKPAVLLAIVGPLAFIVNERFSPLLLLWAVAFGLGVFQACKRWIDGHRGIKKHSYYLGDSIFSKLPLPGVFRRKRIMARFFDPALCCGIGYLLVTDSGKVAVGLGAWLIISGVFLFAVELRSYRLQFFRDMEMVDGLVYSEYVGGKVESFEDQSKTTQTSRDTEGIPTGLDADLREKINQRR